VVLAWTKETPVAVPSEVMVSFVTAASVRTCRFGREALGSR
jgi:hypothetical protein